jgi:hypothetical protein
MNKGQKKFIIGVAVGYANKKRGAMNIEKF